MKLRLPLFLMTALLACFHTPAIAAPYELSVDGVLETSALGENAYTVISPPSTPSWGISQLDLHIGRSGATIFTINFGASLQSSGIFLNQGSTLNLLSSLTTKTFNASGGATNLSGDVTLTTGDIAVGSRSNKISGMVTLDTKAKWKAQGETTWSSDASSKLVLGERTTSPVSSFGQASINIGSNTVSDVKSIFTTYKVEGTGSVFIGKSGVWQAYGNTSVNRLENTGSLIIGDGTNAVAFTSAASGGQSGSIYINKNATWIANNNASSSVNVGKVTVEGIWDMSNTSQSTAVHNYLTQGLELVGGSTVKMNLTDSIKTQSGTYNLTFTGSGPYNLELIYSALSGKDYTLMTFSNAFDASQFTLKKGTHSLFELRAETSGSTTSLVWKYLTKVITYTNAEGEIKNRSAKWTFNDDASSSFKATNFGLTVNQGGVLSTTKGSVFSSGSMLIKDGGKWMISGDDAVILGGNLQYLNKAMSVLVQDGGVLNSAAVLKINGLQGTPAASLTVTGAMSSWTATNDVYLASTAGGSGMVNIEDGAKWTTSHDVWLSLDENGVVATDSTSTINLNKATWISTGAVTGAANSSINISEGSTWNAALDTSVGSLMNNGTWYSSGNAQISSSLTNTGDLYIGGSGAIGSITAKSATLTGGTLFFDYVKGSQDQLKVTESLTLSGPMSIDLGINGWLGADGSDATSYTLISYQSGLSMIDHSNIILKGLWLGTSRQTYSLDFSEDGEIRLMVTGKAARLTWNGEDNAAWSLGSSTWTPDPETADKHFLNNDYVVFDGTKTLTVDGAVWTSLLSVTDASIIMMNTEAGQIISTIIQNSGELTINGGEKHHFGSVENDSSSVLTLDGVRNSEMTSITGGTLTLAGGSDVSMAGDGSKLTTLDGDGVLTVNKTFSVENANAAMIKAVSDASINVANLNGSSLEFQAGSTGAIDKMSKGRLNIDGGSVEIGRISGGEVVMNDGSVSLDTFGGTSDLVAQYEMHGGKLSMKNFESYGNLTLTGGTLNLKYFQATGSSLKVSGGEVVVAFYMQDYGVSSSVNISDGKFSSLGLVQISSTTLSSGELVVGAIVGSLGTVFNYDGGSLKFNLSQNLELYRYLVPIGPKVDHYSFFHDMGGEGNIGGSLSESLKTGDLFGAELVVSLGGGADLLGKTFSISNQSGVDFASIKIEGSILQKTESGKTGIWSFGGLNFRYTFDGNKLVFSSYASEIIKPPVITLAPDGDGFTSVHEEMILKTGNTTMTGGSLTVSLASPGDKPGEDAGAASKIQLGSGLENSAHAGLKGSSLATYLTTVNYNSDGIVIDTQYEKQQDAFGLLVSGSEVLKSATNDSIAVIGKVAGNTSNTAIASINSSAGASLTLENTQINLTNEDGDFASRIENSTITLKGDSLLSGVSASNAIQMNNSNVQGSGALENVLFNGGSLCAGNSPGVMLLNNITTSGTAQGTMKLQAQICNFGNNIELDGMNNTTASGSGNVSQFNITGNVTLGAGTVFEIVLWNDAGIESFDTKTLEQGAKFQFFTFNGGSIIGEFAGLLNAPTLADGLMWDMSQLTTGGFAQVIWSSIADGSRIANTLWTSGQTVSNISTEAVKHVGEAVTGKTTVWLSSLNDFSRASSEGMSTGYDFNTQGYSVGAQHGVEGGHVIGLAFGNSYGTHTPLQGSTHASAGKIKQDAVMGTVYGRIMLSKAEATDNIWSIDAYAGYGEVSNKSTRTVKFDSSTAAAKWSDMIKTVGIQGNYATKLNEKTILTPFAGLDFIYGEQDNFTEEAKTVKASYNNGAYYNLRASLGASISHVVEFSNGMALIPSLTASYGYDVCRMNPHTDVSEAGGDYRAYGVNPGRNSFQITPALSWKISKAWSASTNYTLRTRSGLTDQSVNASVGYTF